MTNPEYQYFSEEEYEEFFRSRPEYAKAPPPKALSMRMDVDDYDQFMDEVRARQHLLSEAGVTAKAQVEEGKIAVALTARDNNLQIRHVRRLREVRVVGTELSAEGRASLKRFLDIIRSHLAPMGIPLNLS